MTTENATMIRQTMRPRVVVLRRSRDGERDREGKTWVEIKRRERPKRDKKTFELLFGRAKSTDNSQWG